MNKGWLHKLRNVFDVKINSEFNFDNYIREIGFKYLRDKGHYKERYRVFSHNDYKLYLILNEKKEEILIYKKDKMLSKINFIPKGSLFVDLWINQVIISFNNDATEQK